ncbi:DUF4262 domain-containing protein [Microbacterium sp. NPDC091313]
MPITPTPAELAWLDQEDRRVTQTVRRYGVALEHVWGDGAARRPSFTYTVGLFGIDHPELLVFDLTPEDAAELLNTMAARVRAGEDFVAGTIVKPFEGDPSHPHADRRVGLEWVPNPGEIVFSANRFAHRPSEYSVPALQIVWTDDAGRFPRDDGYAQPLWRQPTPGTFRA